MPRDEMNLSSTFTFGKHQGKTVKEVLQETPRYLAWMVENDVAPLEHEVIEVLEDLKLI